MEIGVPWISRRRPFPFQKPRLAIVENCKEEGGSYADKSLLAWRVDDLTALDGA